MAHSMCISSLSPRSIRSLEYALASSMVGTLVPDPMGMSTSR